MAALIALPYRASDASFVLVPDATAYFFDEGSSTPLEVFSDEAMTISLGTSVAADAEGIFPQCWVADDTGVKVDIQDGTLVPLPGFPQDNFPTIAGGGLSAVSTAFTPTVGNSGTTVQQAIENDVARLNRFDNAAELRTSAGTASAFTLTSGFPITMYATGQEIEFRAHAAPSGACTVNRDGIGAIAVKKLDASNAKVDIEADDWAIGDVVRMKFDGTHQILINKLYPIATQAEAEGGTDNLKRMTPLRVAQAINANGWKFAPTVVLAGGETEVDFTGIPGGINELSVFLDAVDAGADRPELQFGTAGGFITSGYKYGSGAYYANAANGGGINAAASGFLFETYNSGQQTLAHSRWLRQNPSTHVWSGGGGFSAQNGAGDLAGIVTLGAALTQVRLLPSGASTFEAGGEITVGWRY